ncbi:unnamed protein product, partial [Polarella glacialis]
LRVAANRLDAFPKALLEHPRLAWVAVGSNPFTEAALKRLLASAPDVLDFKELSLGARLGSGAGATVYSAEWRQRQVNRVAAKPGNPALVGCTERSPQEAYGYVAAGAGLELGLVPGLSPAEVLQVVEASGAARSFQGGSGHEFLVAMDPFLTWLGLPPCCPGPRTEALGELEVAWAEVVPIPDKYQRSSQKILRTEHRAIHLGQLEELAELLKEVLSKADLRDSHSSDARITWQCVNLYHINDHVVMPLTRPARCSFVELVASGPQKPVWFVSHWWGTPFRQTVELLGFHASKRHLPKECPYWICTFANNQHDLGELAGSLSDTPFFVAILEESCQGTVALLDENVTTFKRIWCVLENYVSTVETAKRCKPHLYDLAAYLEDGIQCSGRVKLPAMATLLLDNADGTSTEATSCVGGTFPFYVAEKAVSLDIKTAEASRPEDQRSILHMIAGTPEAERHQPPPGSHEQYEALNRNARRRFAGPAMYWAAYKDQPQLLKGLLFEFPEAKDEGNNDGTTAALIAAGKDHTECLKLLAQACADLNKAKDNGFTPLLDATQRLASKQTVELLLEWRADVNRQTAQGMTAVGVAVENRSTLLLCMLMAARADVRHADNEGATPLLIAAQSGFVSALGTLIAAKAEVNKAMDTGLSPLLVASSAGHLQVVLQLIAARADVNQGMPDGCAALAAAVDFGECDVVEALLAARADCSHTWKGRTPAAMAKDYNDVDMLRLLEAGELQT